MKTQYQKLTYSRGQIGGVNFNVEVNNRAFGSIIVGQVQFEWMKLYIK